MKINIFFCLFVVSFIQLINAQSVEIKAKISAPDEVEGIHIINKTASKFTISNTHGEFTIPVQLNDTLLFSGISYKPKEIVVTKLILAAKICTVYLEELVNALDQVVVGKILTGDLLSDINNSDLKKNINFYDLGIPGYTGKPKTQSERRLYTAGDFKPIHLLSLLGGSLDVDPILNAISGLTKELKHRVYLEKEEDCLNKMKSNLSSVLFSDEALDESYRNEFFYYCTDDPRFDDLCLENNDFHTFEFLQEKLINFKVILKNANN